MKVLIDISKKDLDRIEMLLSKNKISSISNFVSMSIQNQIALESGVSNIPTLESLIQSPVESTKVTLKEKKKEQGTPELPKDMIVNAMKIHDDFPFWGTQNKYLCLKQITLGVVKLASEEGKPWLRYDIVMNRLLQQAVETRKHFEAIDKLLHRPRGERFSTGFPKNDIKSMTRYEKQFIGGIDGNDKLYGMAAAIGFLAIRKEKSSNRVEFGITENGLNFSVLGSPVFHKDPTNLTPSTPTLSDNEVQFIITMLKKVKKSEINLMEFTLKYIASGKKLPEDGSNPTKEYLDRTYPDIAIGKKDGSFSLSEADTIRAGVISRLNELGLIKIIKKGIKSEYQITETGKKFLDDMRRK